MSRFPSIPLKYVGDREEWFDHLYGSGITFKKDRVKAVPPHYAVSLLKHPEFIDARPADKQEPIQYDPNRQYEHLQQEVEREDLPPLVDINLLHKEQLVQYAKRYFGKDLSDRDLKADLIQEVRTLMHQRGQEGSRY